MAEQLRFKFEGALPPIAARGIIRQPTYQGKKKSTLNEMEVGRVLLITCRALLALDLVY
jgi:hypothetical protein